MEAKNTITKKHGYLIQLESLINKLIGINTNTAYAAGYKHKYGIAFTKGDKVLEGEGKKINHYYTFRFFYIDNDTVDKKEMIIQEIHYPVKPLLSVHKLHEKALEDFLSSGVSALAYVQSAVRQREQEDNAVKELINTKSKLFSL